SDRITGVPVSIIKTPYIDKVGIKAGVFACWMLKGNKTKHWMRMFYMIRSVFQLRKSSLDEKGETEFWQAGKSVSGIHRVESVATIIGKYEAALGSEKL
ncbi:MAG: nitronate monooxygenase, partial [Candidatus Thiodiazotropha sp. (ex Lucinoma kastoroae)]|nr:nitronate monooxygenase [Candidatus Thiodiazotropha sp. (ex Lucinoma kastoroae)]